MLFNMVLNLDTLLVLNWSLANDKHLTDVCSQCNIGHML
jgi:hypothetical protein